MEAVTIDSNNSDDNNSDVCRDLAGPLTFEDQCKMVQVLDAWAGALETTDSVNDVRTIFFAAISTISVMGLDYCRLAAINLLDRAENFKSR